jgi:NAD(P)H dehydrogenase (quinone)
MFAGKTMTDARILKTLITGATGQVGSRTIDFLLHEKDIEIVAAVRSPEKAVPFTARGIATVILDLDNERTHLPALKGIDRLFLLTGYTVDMLRQSKAVLDTAQKAGVRHVVHLGACRRDDTTVAHWAWHQFVERYIEWSGFPAITGKQPTGWADFIQKHKTELAY